MTGRAAGNRKVGETLRAPCEPQQETREHCRGHKDKPRQPKYSLDVLSRRKSGSQWSAGHTTGLPWPRGKRSLGGLQDPHRPSPPLTTLMGPQWKVLVEVCPIVCPSAPLRRELPNPRAAPREVGSSLAGGEGVLLLLLATKLLRKGKPAQRLSVGDMALKWW
jgi:hypothetical protein